MCKINNEVEVVEVPEVDYKQLIENVIEGVFTYIQGGIEYSSDYDSSFGTYEGKEFLIASSWNEVEAIEKELGHSLDEMLSDDWGFNDEYALCHGCGNVLRISPDCYQWQPEYVEIEGSRLCKECLDIPDYLESIENNPRTANQVCSEEEILTEGYVRLNDTDYESGWYGTNDNPAEIYNKLKNKYRAIIFSITEQQQFMTGFAVYGKDEVE